MKAAIIQRPGVIVVGEAPKPVIQPGEALIRVRYNGICGTDVHLLHGNHPTMKMPLIPGHEIVGEVEEVSGKGAERFQTGDVVVAQELITCGICDACAKGSDNVCRELQIIGIHADGGLAQYVRVMTHKMYALPKDIDLRLAALVEPLAVAVHDVRKSGLKVGETALVIGGGPIGLLIAIVARANGAGKVVIGEVNEYRRNYAKNLGFDVADPLDPDAGEQIRRLGGGCGFDVSFEAAGADSSIAACIEHTKNTGTIVAIAMTKGPVPVDTGKIFAKELTIVGVRVHSHYNFIGAVNMVKSGLYNDVLMGLVSRIYPLDQTARAFEDAEKNKECFKVLIEIN